MSVLVRALTKNAPFSNYHQKHMQKNYLLPFSINKTTKSNVACTFGGGCAAVVWFMVVVVVVVVVFVIIKGLHEQTLCI